MKTENPTSKKTSALLYSLPEVVSWTHAKRTRSVPCGTLAAPLALGLEDLDAMKGVDAWSLGAFMLSIYRLSWYHDLAGAFLLLDSRARAALEDAQRKARLEHVSLGLLLRICIPATLFFPFDKGRLELGCASRFAPSHLPAGVNAVSILQTAIRARVEGASPSAPPEKAPRRKRRKRLSAVERQKREERRNEERKARLSARRWARFAALATGDAALHIPRRGKVTIVPRS